MAGRPGAGRLLWSDEFDGPALAPPDPGRWVHETGAGGWGNGEVQRYTADPANAAHDGAGNLVLRALPGVDGITSARLVTKDRFAFAYGRLEVRARPPAGQGLWSAVWMLGADIDAAGWPACGEIDVMEVLGADPARVLGTAHCPGHAGPEGLGGAHRARGLPADGFRVFAVDWSPEAIAWSVDGETYFRLAATELGRAWVFDHPFYVLVNLAVGGTLGGAVDAVALPAEFRLDYLRVYAA